MPDSQPNYLTTDASGAVGAVFAGGVDLPAALPTDDPYTGKAIRWKRTDTGALVAYVVAVNDANIIDLQMLAQNDAVTSWTGIDMVTRKDGASGSLNIKAAAVGANQALTLINTRGESNFLKIGAGSGDLGKSGTGRAVINWNGAATQAIVAGGPGTPTVTSKEDFSVVATPRIITGDIGNQFTVDIESFTTSQFIIRLTAVGFIPGAGITHVDYVWSEI